MFAFARLVLVVAVLAACGDNLPSDPEPDAAMPRDCGPPPAAPFPTLTHGTDTVTMSASDWQLVVEFRDKALNWFACAESGS